MPTGDATWQVGVINVPGSTGSVAYTGLGGTPGAVFFYGSNWLTEDTAVTTSGTGLFRGMAALKYDDPGTIIQNACGVLPVSGGYLIDNHAVDIRTPGALPLYRADLTSFDADGFTLNWLVAPGSYKVIYVALMDITNVGAGTTSAGSFNDSLGWKAGAMLLHGNWGTLSATDTNRNQQFFGGAAYPGTVGGGSWFGAGLTAFSFPASANQQYNADIYNQAPGTVIAQSGNFIGPSLTTQNVTAIPTGVGLQDLTLTTNLSDNQAVFVAWDDEDSTTEDLVPGTTTGDTVTVTGLPFEPGLVIGYSIGDEPPGQGSSDPSGARGALGFSVITPSFQWTALVDDVNSRGSYQSFQRGVVAAASGTSFHASTVTLTDDGFIVETEEDDVAPHRWVWHAFGHPRKAFMWIPHIYRRVMDFGGGSGTTVVGPPAEDLLLEDGDSLLLEDGLDTLALE